MKGRECMGGCGREENKMMMKRIILHKIKHKPNNFISLFCTHCLLNHHLPLFCPFCFQLYPPDEEDEDDKVVCLKCPSVSHLSCIPSTYSHSPPSFLCPSCSNPHLVLFNSDPPRALVCAAQISAVSMTQAASLARLQADHLLKEAAFAKKRAQEALDTLASFPSIPNSNNNNSFL